MCFGYINQLTKEIEEDILHRSIKSFKSFGKLNVFWIYYQIVCEMINKKGSTDK